MRKTFDVEEKKGHITPSSRMEEGPTSPAYSAAQFSGESVIMRVKKNQRVPLNVYGIVLRQDKDKCHGYLIIFSFYTKQ